jgi:hypothetical protein
MRAAQLASSRFYEVGAGCYDLSEKRANLLPKSISGTLGIRSVPCCEHPTLLTEACSRTFDEDCVAPSKGDRIGARQVPSNIVPCRYQH